MRTKMNQKRATTLRRQQNSTTIEYGSEESDEKEF
jgi:hypothetical protein